MMALRIVAPRAVLAACRASIAASYAPKMSSFNAFSTNTVKMTFIEEASDSMVEVQASIGKTVLDTAIENNIDIEGACGGELACSTCHVVLPKALYDKLPAKKEEEEDMLDLALGLTPTSRLCCQLKVTEELEGAVFKVPKDTNNMLR